MLLVDDHGRVCEPTETLRVFGIREVLYRIPHDVPTLCALADTACFVGNMEGENATHCRSQKIFVCVLPQSETGSLPSLCAEMWYR